MDAIRRIELGVVVVTRSRSFFETGLSVLNDVRADVFEEVSIDADLDHEVKLPSIHPVYEEAREKAIRFLASRKDRLTVRVIQAETLERAAEKLAAAYRSGDGSQLKVGMIYVDDAHPGCEETPQETDGRLVAFHARLKAAGVETLRSPYSAAVFTLPRRNRVRYHPLEYIECVLPVDRSVLQAQLLCLWMDFFEMTYANRRARPDAPGGPRSALGEQLISFLTERAGTDWLGFYYTGSVVSNLINYFETEAGRRGVQLLRGPNEHALACGAIANWQLYRKPFVIIVTSGMLDELKGTLTNLREARAQGFIICAEGRADQWFGFQSTISRDEDAREVLAARRIPHLYLDDVERLGEDLVEAARLFDAGRGPVVLLATPAVLDANRALQVEFPGPAAAAPSGIPAGAREPLAKVMELINRGPDRVLWQCGPMDEEELRLTLSIAERAGIALADSLVHPGAVPKFHGGVRVRNYLGPLAIYGYNPRVYGFLHTNDQLNPPSEQCVFFLKSKLPQVATPFSEARLQRKLHVVQLTDRPEHVAPFADHALVLDYRAFLAYVDAHLEVSPALRERRYRVMDAVPDTPSDVVSRLAKSPMSPNYFFAQLNALVERLIVEEGFDYTGLYDVGRCGISAVRNVARTRLGFSGWYGRALMGDALLAAVSVAQTSPTHVVAFIGDGARGVVPDLLPAIAEHALSYPGRLRNNLTVFTFLNGGHSIINTYQERVLFRRTSRQMRLVNVLSDDWEEDICGVRVCARTLHSFEPEILGPALLRPACVNLFSVVLSHNNEGDGLSLVTATGWQRDVLTFPGVAAWSAPARAGVLTLGGDP